MEDPIETAVRALADALRAELATAAPPADAPDRLLSIPDAARALGIGRSSVYAEMSSGRLRSVKVGRRRLVPSGALTIYTRQDAA